MPPKNLTDSVTEVAFVQSGSSKTLHEMGFKDPISTAKAQNGSKNSTFHEDSGHKTHETVDDNSSARERLKRHRVEVAGRVWIPETWGHEDFLKDWIDSSAFDASVANSGIMSARASLVEEGRRAKSSRFTIHNSC